MILKVIDNRLKSKVEEHVDGVQFGFRKIKGLVMQSFVPRAITERAIEKQKDLFVCFVDAKRRSI